MTNDPITWRHQVPAQLRFTDVDPFGHVNNSVYFALFDMAKTQYVMQVVGDTFLHTTAIVVANIQADFIAPIYYPDEIAIQTAVTHLGNKSFVFTQRAINVRTQEVKCICRTTMVTFDIAAKATVELPARFRSQVAAYEGIPAAPVGG
ncbi:MAG: acyl-CoA thioesterase [Prevotella sp.]